MNYNFHLNFFVLSLVFSKISLANIDDSGKISEQKSCISNELRKTSNNNTVGCKLIIGCIGSNLTSKQKQCSDNHTENNVGWLRCAMKEIYPIITLSNNNVSSTACKAMLQVGR